MATDWAKDVKKYAADADDGIIAGIVRYCGIALRNRDSSLVSFSDPTELARVRNNFLKKKLGLTHSDEVLDAAIAKVGERMKADRTKNRVTVYYLLAEAHGMLDLFAKKTAAKAADKAPAAKAEKPGAKAGTKSKVAGAAAAAGVAAAAAAAKPKKAPAKKADGAGKADAAKPAKAPAAKKSTSAKVAGAAAAATGGAAMLAGNLGEKAAGAASAAKEAGADAVDAVKDGAAKAGAAVASAAGAAGDAASAVVGGAADLAGKAAGAAGDAAGAAAGAVGAGAAAVAGAAGAAVAGAAGLASGAADKLGSAAGGAVQQLTGGSNDDEGSGLGWLWLLLLGALLAFALWWLFFRSHDDQAASPVVDASAAADAGAATGGAVDLAAAPAEGTVTIPAGAGVTSETRDGKPVVKVYFDTGKTDVAPAFAGTAGGLKAWLDGHAGSSLAVSGYNDPTGNAAANALLSKNRAKAVAAELVKAGIPETSVALVKPEASTDANVPKEAARRVEVTVK